MWDTSQKRWYAQWKAIKPGAYNDLYLALYTPHGVYVLKHDGTFGMTTSGKQQAACGGCTVGA